MADGIDRREHHRHNEWYAGRALFDWDQGRRAFLVTGLGAFWVGCTFQENIEQVLGLRGFQHGIRRPFDLYRQY